MKFEFTNKETMENILNEYVKAYNCFFKLKNKTSDEIIELNKKITPFFSNLCFSEKIKAKKLYKEEINKINNKTTKQQNIVRVNEWKLSIIEGFINTFFHSQIHSYLNQNIDFFKDMPFRYKKAKKKIKNDLNCLLFDDRSEEHT